jgi:hypothetical protein
MILRRVIKHVRQQEWTAIFLDFLIVVVGVFVGLQVQNWNEARILATEKASAIERLQGEAENVVTYFQRMINFYDDVNSARSEAIQRLVDNDWSGADLGRMTNGLASGTLLPSAAPPRSVYDEIINTGLYSEIGDSSLRNALAKYYSQLEFLQNQIVYLRQGAQNHPIWENKNVTLVFKPGTSRERAYVMNFEALSKDEAFKEKMISDNNRIRANTGWWKTTLNDAKAVCEAVAIKSGRACSPAEPEPLR